VPPKSAVQLLFEAVAGFASPSSLMGRCYGSRVKDDHVLPQAISGTNSKVHKHPFVDRWEKLLLSLAQQDTCFWALVLLQKLEGHHLAEPGPDRHLSVCCTAVQLQQTEQFLGCLRQL